MPLSDNLRGAAFMCAAMAFFSVNDAFMKKITQTMPLFETIALRGLVTVLGLGLLVILTAGGQFRMTRRNAGLTGLRATGEVLGTFAFLGALMHMPLATLTAIFQALPLAVTLSAAVVFRDRIGWRRLAAIIVGFVGVLIIIRPGAASFDIWSLVALSSVAFIVLRELPTRRLGTDVPSVTVAFWSAVAVTLSSGLVALGQGWSSPDGATMAMILAAGALVMAGYITSIRAVRLGDISFVAPYRYTALLWGVLLGWFVFSDFPDGWTFVGAGVVIASGLFTIWREAALRRAARSVDIPPDSPYTPRNRGHRSA
jgi:drug/metabolite transporter (DMT)-like permease